MNTKHDSQNSFGQFTQPTLMSRSDIPELLPGPLAEVGPVPRWCWRAEHLLSRRETVTGGRAQIRMLVSAIDGESWPWTTVLNVDDTAWFQVLGTHKACVLEIATRSSIAMVARAHDRNVTQHDMPEGCRYWIPSCRSDELFTSWEAADIGIAFLTGMPLPSSLTLRDVHLGDPESRYP